MKKDELNIATPAGEMTIKAISTIDGVVDVGYCHNLSSKNYRFAVRFCDAEGFTETVANECM